MPDDGLLGLRPIEHHGPVGVMPNVQHQNAGFLSGAPYELAFVEFDDQGRCYDRTQMDAVATRLDAMRADQLDAIILVFVHGWKHDARSNDANLTSFRELLVQAVQHEQAIAGPGRARPVLGIFVGWRGLTSYGPTGLVADATFLRRQAAGQRVAFGSARELFGRLRHYRNARADQGGSPLLVLAGHSFGGMIVYSALAQSLIEAASDPAGRLDSRFADLVLLVNPAIEGARYLPVHDLMEKPDYRARVTPQLPLFVCVQADNDEAVGTWFPIGNARNGVEEDAIGDLEKRCITHAIGFIDEFATHRLDAQTTAGPAVLSPPAPETISPFWVVRANPAVIDGHGGIWQPSFKTFLAGLVFAHVSVSRGRELPIGGDGAWEPGIDSDSIEGSGDPDFSGNAGGA